MRCVSCTRAATCYRGTDKQAFTIPEQNEHIRDYVKSRGLTICQKYSDRGKSKEGAAGFESMRLDGQNGQFDMLITDSIWQCGTDIFQIVRVLKDTFYPAGIEFAIVQEDFCSMDHTKEEVNQYLDDLWHRYRSHLTESRLKKNSGKYHLDAFGYRYNEEADRLEIDEESAAVVREIFEQLKSGKKPSDIGKELTERSVENPGDYRCRMRGWALRGSNRGWNEGTVYAVAKNPKFAGRWERVIDGRDYASDCDPIVDTELFDAVQQLFDQRRHHKKDCQKTENPFLKMMTDEETGATVIMKKNQNTGIYDFHFKYPKPAGVVYEKSSMLFDEAIAKARSELNKEKAAAQAAAKNISSGVGTDYRNYLIDLKRSSCKEKIARLIDPEADAFEEIEQDILEIQRISLALSAENPWIKLFLEYDERQDLTRDYLIRFAKHVYIRRFEEIRIAFREAEWKQMIPPYWMEVR